MTGAHWFALLGLLAAAAAGHSLVGRPLDNGEPRFDGRGLLALLVVLLIAAVVAQGVSS